MTILILISLVQLPSLFNTLPKKIYFNEDDGEVNLRRHDTIYIILMYNSNDKITKADLYLFVD